MGYPYLILLIALACIGHIALWVTIVNRLNAYALHYVVLRWANRTCLLMCALIPLVAGGVWLWFGKDGILSSSGVPIVHYAGLCQPIGIWAVGVWILRRLWANRVAGRVRLVQSERFDVSKRLGVNLVGNRKAALCAWLPGNEIFQVQVTTKELSLSFLPPALDGLSIVHLSDLHFASHVRRDYYGEVVRQANALVPDLIAITGDVIDRPQCLDWFGETLGRLRAPLGVYFILGNHDGRRVPVDKVRQTLVDLGLRDLGGRSEILEHNGAKILLAGNELPWLQAPPQSSEMFRLLRDSNTLSLLLSHSPDQLFWAQGQGYQLMLAGHVHGGQIRLPIVGPMLCPSRYGVRFASGVFYEPPTLLHVTRGICGMMPLRFNCPPELAKLVLRSSAGHEPSPNHSVTSTSRTA